MSNWQRTVCTSVLWLFRCNWL